MKQYRQGDVFIEAVEALPAGAQALERKGGRLILAEGEATGHHHAVLERDAELLTTAAAADLWLRVGSGGATVTHEEHGAIEVPEGIYRIRRQREYSPEAIRRVAD